MDHSFNVAIAKKYGVHEAIFIHNLYFWIGKNVGNGRHFYDGRNWTYNSLSAMEMLFPYFSRRQIRTVIDNCVNKGAVIKGSFNKAGYDKTSWYALTEDVLKVYRGYAEIDMAYAGIDTTYVRSDTSYARSDTTIPDSKPDSKPDIHRAGAKAPRARFEKPTVEEIGAYCAERRNGIDAQHFVDYYESRSWVLKSGQKMTDWKASIRSWEHRDKERQAPAKQNPSAKTGDSSLDMDKMHVLMHGGGG